MLNCIGTVYWIIYIDMFVVSATGIHRTKHQFVFQMFTNNSVIQNQYEHIKYRIKRLIDHKRSKVILLSEIKV